MRGAKNAIRTQPNENQFRLQRAPEVQPYARGRKEGDTTRRAAVKLIVRAQAIAADAIQ